MKCDRCGNGCFKTERTYTFEGAVESEVCVICGEVFDDQIRNNRMRMAVLRRHSPECGREAR